MPTRRCPVLLAVFLVVAGLAAGGVTPACAQEREGRTTSIFRGLRDRLLGRGGPDALREAMLLPDGRAAREVMEGLAGRGGDAVTAARAALWLGHYHYGAGDTEAALGWFEKARSGDGGAAERAESDFWTAQCRNLLGRAQDAAPGGGGEGAAAVLGRVARLDGELRVGRVESALRGYVDLEGEARQAGCLGPLLYRIGLAASAGAGTGEIGWSTVAAWAPSCVASPEYALVRAMQPAVVVPAAAPAASPGDTLAVPFVEAAGGPGTGASGLEHPATTGATEAINAGGAPVAAAEAADGEYSIQLGSYRDADRARAEAARLGDLGLAVRLDVRTENGETRNRILLGRYRSQDEAEETALARCTGLEWRIIRVEP
jgi:cell division septation protein DedD